MSCSGWTHPDTFVLIKKEIMQIIINDHRKIHAIQEEFSTLFPNLKLEFYAKPPHIHAAHPNKIITASSKTLGECRNVHNKGRLSISAGMTIAELVNNFNEVYGIDIEVLRKKGHEWIEALDKNKLTLQEQNNQ
jgi:hypothetical protein